MTVIDEHLIPSSSAGESIVFYYKMKGDYYRYLSEFKYGNDKNEESNQALSKNLSSTHPIRLGLALNFSVFYYEIDNSPESLLRFRMNLLLKSTQEKLGKILWLLSRRM